MTKLNRTILISVAALMGAAFTSAAMAAPAQFCQTYARIAVNQATQAQNLNLSCSGFRWHNWYDGHYQWCRSTSKASAQSETFMRKRALFGGAC
ncbi:MAG TPA: hypothetical protein VM325_00010 [Alphaproteobacteria bacterium]|nr:hypothetical protein [Alphaproteobacteria bacterium]